MKIRRLLVSSLIASAVTLGMSYAAFEYWVTLQTNTLSKAVAQGKLTEVTAKDIDRIDNLANFVAQSPLPWHQQQAKHLTDLMEVAQAAQQTFNSEKVGQLQVGQLLTLQREMENYVQRYPNQAFTAEFQQELPAVRSLVTFFPIIKASAGERSVDSALRASRRGATLAALVIRNPAELVADNIPAEPAEPAAPVVAWSKAENDVLYDYSQALQDAERSRLGNPDRLAIGHQVCSWLETGQGYWGVRSLFDLRYKNQVAGDYYHNRDAYIRFSTERLCPDKIASITPPAEPSDVQVAKVPAAVAKVAETAVNSYTSATNSNANTSPRWAAEVKMPQNGPQYGVPYPVQPLPPGAVPFPGGIR